MKTIKALEKIGVHYIGTKDNPNKFHIPAVGDIQLYKPYSFEAIYKAIYFIGKEVGRENGEISKMLEIKEALGID